MIKNSIKKLNNKISQINEKKKWPKDSVGRLMILKVPLIRPEQSLSDAQAILLKELRLKKIETINYFYVVDENKKLIGVFSIKELFQNSLQTKVKEIMKKKLVKLFPKDDQEQAVYLALKNNIKSIPITDKNNVFLGIIPGDYILDILNKEVSEDLLYMAGIYQPKRHLNIDNNLSIPIFKSIKNRLPWLIAGLLGGILAAKIISLFESALEKNIILAMFIPVILYMSNAVGSQTQALFLMDLAVSRKIPFLKYLVKQIITCFFVAIGCGALLFLFTLFGWSAAYLGFILSLAMFFTIIVAVFFSLIIPFILNKLKMDPALGSGPFTAIVQDILSIVIYFSIANWLL